jgi:hypothetical protein
MELLSKNPGYRRLNVSGYGLTGSASYWLGRDHLLVVATRNYVENYYRFLYSDIQGIIVRRNPFRLIWGLVFSVLTVTLLLGALAVKLSEPAGNISEEGLFGMAGLLALALAFASLQTINLLRGPTCACHLRTAVQLMALPQLHRWRKAELLIAELTPLALAAQAALPTASPAEPLGEPDAAAGMPDDPNLPPRIQP